MGLVDLSLVENPIFKRVAARDHIGVNEVQFRLDSLAAWSILSNGSLSPVLGASVASLSKMFEEFKPKDRVVLSFDVKRYRDLLPDSSLLSFVGSEVFRRAIGELTQDPSVQHFLWKWSYCPSDTTKFSLLDLWRDTQLDNYCSIMDAFMIAAIPHLPAEVKARFVLSSMMTQFAREIGGEAYEGGERKERSLALLLEYDYHLVPKEPRSTYSVESAAHNLIMLSFWHAAITTSECPDDLSTIMYYIYMAVPLGKDLASNEGSVRFNIARALLSAAGEERVVHYWDKQHVMWPTRVICSRDNETDDKKLLGLTVQALPTVEPKLRAIFEKNGVRWPLKERVKADSIDLFDLA